MNHNTAKPETDYTKNVFIHTILGDIVPEELGFCQCHEHLLLSKGRSFEQNPVLWMDEPKKSMEELRLYKQSGGNAVIDAQPVGCNRMEMQLASISRKTGVHILASTGFHKLSFYPEFHWLFSFSCERLQAIFINELQTGMYINCDQSFSNIQCQMQASMIKTAFDVEGLSSRYQRLFRAAAFASLNTATPIMLHIEQGCDPRIILEYLTKLGVSPDQLIFCHLDRACSDLAVHRELLSRGAYLEYDTIGRYQYHSDAAECIIIKNMLSHGYEDQILFSLDTTRKRMKAYDPNGIGLNYILTDFIPLMKSAGITDLQIKKMSHTNCIKILSKCSKGGKELSL